MVAAALAVAPAACRNGAPSRAEGPVAGNPADGLVAGNPACDLLTEAELTSAVGAAVSSTTPADLGVRGLPGSACIYIFEGPGNQAVLISRSDSPEAQSVLAQVRARAGDHARPVPGSDDAVVVGQEAFLRKGSVLVSVTLSLDQDAVRTAATATRLAAAVAKRV